MNTSESIGDLAGALATAQGAFKVARRSGNNPYVNATYSTLSDIIEATREALAANGLSFVQTPEPCGQENVVIVATRLMHSSGQWIESATVMPVINVGKDRQVKPNDIQTFMSALTYAKRAGLSAMLGIVSDADDDGNAAAGRTPPAKNAKPDPTLPATEEQLKAIRRICDGKFDPEQTALDWFKTPLAQLTTGQAAECIQRLNKATTEAKGK